MARLPDANRARRQQQAMKSTAVDSLVMCHKDSLLGLLQSDLHILGSSGVAEAMRKREDNLKMSHRAELAALEKKYSGHYPRTWRGLLTLLRDLVLPGK